MDVISSPATASSRSEEAMWGVRPYDQMIVCLLYANIVYESHSSNLVVGLQDIVNVLYRVFHIANKSPLRSVTCAERKSYLFVLRCGQIVICPRSH